MAQNRDAPAYQEYAASMLAKTEFRVMSLEARGLLYTLRLECWVNGKMPADPATLGRMLGFPAEQIERALIEVSPLLKFVDGVIRCAELDDYRAHLDDRRQRQAEGGKKGAAITNGARAPVLTTRPAGHSRGARGSLVQASQAKHSKSKAGIEGETDVNEFVDEMNSYRAQSRGY